jgi:uncharacterized protein
VKAAVRLGRIAVVVLLSPAILVACVRTPQIRYYTIGADASDRSVRAEPARYTVRVGPASVPEILDRPELVLRVSPTEVTIDDQRRWAEPLRSGIARAVAGDLARELDGARVLFAPEGTTKETTNVEVTIEVQRLDVTLGVGAGVDVAWVARWTDDGHTRTGRSSQQAPAAPGGSYDALVVACAQALAAVSGDIARSVRAESVARR